MGQSFSRVIESSRFCCHRMCGGCPRITCVVRDDAVARWISWLLCGLSGRRRRSGALTRMMVALLLYAYARGIRSSRVIERACVEDVAFRVIAAQRQPDHATIARFIERHQDAIGGLFGEVLTLCARNGLAQCGGDRGRRHEGHGQRQPQREPRLRADRSRDRRGSDRDRRRRGRELGEARGDELPEELRDRRARGPGCAKPRAGSRPSATRDPQPMPRDRPKRLKEAKRRLDEELWSEIRANEAYERYRARGRMKDGRRFGRPPESLHAARDTRGPDQHHRPRLTGR